jgi:hypothetical protein
MDKGNVMLRLESDLCADVAPELSSICRWPAERPAITEAPALPGWMCEGVRELIARDLSPETRLVVELGSWVGLSTRFIADCAPNATVIAIDHWRGSPEHHKEAAAKAMLPSLYETFLALCWDYRDRVVPLRMSTVEGLKVVAAYGLRPDLVYIDAEHSYDAVSGEIDLAHHLFPTAVIVGDDYDWPGIAAAVADACGRYGLCAELAGDKDSGRAWKLTPSEAAPPKTDGPKLEPDVKPLLDALASAPALRFVAAVGSPPADVVVNCEAVRATKRRPQYLTFSQPSIDTGIVPFARIATELARRRPGIPILIVDSQGSGERLLTTGLDSSAFENIHVIHDGGDPRRYWGLTRVALFPWLTSGLSASPAIQSIVNGIPVLASDRAGIVEVMGRAGTILPLPPGVTPYSRALPSGAEMSRWVDAIIQLWDDPAIYEEHVRLAIAEAQYLSDDVEGTSRIACPARPSVREKALVLVPYLDRIEPVCERALSQLEVAGVKVVRKGGCSAIDFARNQLASEAVQNGAESLLFIDSDIAFDPADALRILARPEPVISGVCAKKNEREIACTFADGTESVVFGIAAPRSYVLNYAGGAFLRIQTAVLRRMITDLRLPLCNTRWGKGVWPFFMPLIVDGNDGRSHYLGEDWAFCHRLHQIGIKPIADTFFRLYHIGQHGFSWEETGSEVYRYRTFTLHL